MASLAKGGVQWGWDTVLCTYEVPVASYWSLCHHVLSLLSPAKFADNPELNLSDKEWWDMTPVLPLLPGVCVPQANRMGVPNADQNPAFRVMNLE